MKQLKDVKIEITSLLSLFVVYTIQDRRMHHEHNGEYWIQLDVVVVKSRAAISLLYRTNICVQKRKFYWNVVLRTNSGYSEQRPNVPKCSLYPDFTVPITHIHIHEHV